MNRTALYASLLVALGLAAGASLRWRGEPAGVEPGAARLDGATSPAQRIRASETEAGGDQQTARLERRLELLAAKLAAEADERRQLQQRLDGLATELAALRGNGHETGPAMASNAEPAVAAPSGVTAPATAETGSTAFERALATAGIDATTVTDIKRRRDELALSEIYLRDVAAREGWLDTPTFADQMAEIERQRTSIRDEIGDTAYDRYLAALDHPNRVAVDEVLLDSPAAAAGLQAGDVVLRYGETRIFSPDELVTATRGGTAGETVQVAIIRQGQRFEIAVPRGPLGVRIAASRGDPNEG